MLCASRIFFALTVAAALVMSASAKSETQQLDSRERFIPIVGGNIVNYETQNDQAVFLNAIVQIPGGNCVVGQDQIMIESQPPLSDHQGSVTLMKEFDASAISELLAELIKEQSFALEKAKAVESSADQKLKRLNLDEVLKSVPAAKGKAQRLMDLLLDSCLAK